MLRPNLLFACLIVFCAATNSAEDSSANTYEAKVCIDNYPPLTYFVNGKATGAMIEALNIIGDKMGFSVIASPDTPFARCLRMAEAGLTDFMVSLIPTPERLAYMVMIPYAQVEPLRFIALERNLQTIKLTRLGLVNGFLYPEEFHDKNLQTVLSPTAEAGIRLLRSNRIDVLLLNETVATHLVMHDQQTHQHLNQPIQLLPFSFQRESNANSIALSKKSPLMARVAELETIIVQLTEEGVFERLIEKHQNRP